MNDMERRKFEESFQEAFKDAEVNPSEAVWTNIELDLEKAAGDKMKRRLVFFKTLAAASIIFALCVGGIGYYIFWESDTGSNLAHEKVSAEGQQVSPDENSSGAESASSLNDNPAVIDDRTAESFSSDTDQDAGPTDSPSEINIHDQSPTLDSRKNDGQASDRVINKAEQQKLADATQNAGQTTDPVSTEKNRSVNDPLNSTKLAQDASKKTFVSTDKSQNTNNINTSESKSPLAPEKRSVQSGSEGLDTGRELPLFYEPKLPELQLPESVADPGMLLLARLAEEEHRYASEQKKKEVNDSEKLWTSVGFSAGGFNANNPSVSTPPTNSMYAMNSYSTAAKQSQASGVSYSIGVSMGTKLSNRWVLQGGINYLTQSSDYTANSVVVVGKNFEAPKAESLNAFAAQTLDASAQPIVAQTYPYDVNNAVRFVSVPLQAGYLVIDRKFGLQVNAGVSTDLFLQNTITPDGGGVTKTTQGRGEDSPYRSLNFSGLMGTEFSYKLGYRYRISLNPGLRYPFSSVYKSNTGIDSTPLTFDVGLRFRYIFH
jgi:hypothetical protein